MYQSESESSGSSQHIINFDDKDRIVADKKPFNAYNANAWSYEPKKNADKYYDEENTPTPSSYNRAIEMKRMSLETATEIKQSKM